jgi:hypothetical protein
MDRFDGAVQLVAYRIEDVRRVGLRRYLAVDRVEKGSQVEEVRRSDQLVQFPCPLRERAPMVIEKGDAIR